MFNSEFFPTPGPVLTKMMGGINFAGKIILDPQAGSGAIADYVKEHSKYNNTEIYCIEIEPELRHILHEKGYKVLANDFLQYHGDHLFDYIIMNPPFSNGDEHLLKAWEILEEGEIICLLNAETINNPHTQRRKLLADIIQRHGTVEPIGQAFKFAERPTDVEVVIVRLTKVSQGQRLDFDFQNVASETNYKLNEDTFKNEIATRDVIGNMILSFDALKLQYVQYLKALAGLKFYSQGLLTDHTDIIKLASQSYSDSKNASYNNFTDEVRQNIWSVVMRKTNVEKYMTHQVRQNFQKFAKAQGYMDFTKENVASLVSLIFDNRANIMEQAIVNVFDIFTQYYEENRCHVEGWKTNDSWKVNQKVILPYGVEHGAYMSASSLRQYGDRFHICHHHSDKYSDIDKVMCYLTGTAYASYDENGKPLGCQTIIRALENKFKEIGNVKSGAFDNNCESEFFNIKFFKKGTIHLEFKDRFLWQEFTMRACAGKNWLPPSERREWEETVKARDQLRLSA